MDATPNLSLPYIMAAQSQKHVTHNEAIRALDAIVQLAVLDRDLTAPPGSPADGARYIVGASPTGAWSGHAGNVAAYQDGAWMFYAPVEGWIAWVGDEDAAVVWDGSAWSALTTGGGGGGGSGSYTTLGINATADTTNRLSLAADATLLNHDGDGHQLKINKASAADTASLLYQDAFSGRAELGLAGDDDFHFKVSPDGATWKEAILIDRSTGSVSFPHTSLGGGGGREVLDRQPHLLRARFRQRRDGQQRRAVDGRAVSHGSACARRLRHDRLQRQDRHRRRGRGHILRPDQARRHGRAVDHRQLVIRVPGRARRRSTLCRSICRHDRCRPATVCAPTLQTVTITNTDGSSFGVGIFAYERAQVQIGADVVLVRSALSGSGLRMARPFLRRQHTHLHRKLDISAVRLKPRRFQFSRWNHRLWHAQRDEHGWTARRASFAVFNATTYTGTVTGGKYALSGNSVLQTSNTLPGSAAGTTATGGQVV